MRANILKDIKAIVFFGLQAFVLLYPLLLLYFALLCTQMCCSNNCAGKSCVNNLNMTHRLQQEDKIKVVN